MPNSWEHIFLHFHGRLGFGWGLTSRQNLIDNSYAAAIAAVVLIWFNFMDKKSFKSIFIFYYIRFAGWGQEGWAPEEIQRGSSAHPFQEPREASGRAWWRVHGRQQAELGRHHSVPLWCWIARQRGYQGILQVGRSVQQGRQPAKDQVLGRETASKCCLSIDY